MSADTFATKDGRFTLLVTSYKTGKELGRVEVVGLESNEGIQVEYLEDWEDDDKESL